MRAELRTALILLLAGASTAAWSQSGPVRLAEILHVVGRYPALIRSARVEGVESVASTPAYSQVTHGEVYPHMDKSLVVWAFKGDKRYSQSVERVDPQKQKGEYPPVTRTFTHIF